MAGRSTPNDTDTDLPSQRSAPTSSSSLPPQANRQPPSIPAQLFPPLPPFSPYETHDSHYDDGNSSNHPSESVSDSDTGYLPPPKDDESEPLTPAESLALDRWILHNSSYFTTIPWHRFPSPPTLSVLWGLTEDDFRADCVVSLLFYTRAAGRRLNNMERDAVLEPITRYGVAAGYFRPFSISLTAWLIVRSWRKSGKAEAANTSSWWARQQQQQAQASSIHTIGGSLGGTNVDGHISHFSAPQQHLPYHQPPRPAPAMRSVASTLLRRVGRCAGVGLLCYAGYHVLDEPWRRWMSKHESETLQMDYRLNRMAEDTVHNLRTNAPDLVRRHNSVD